MCPTRLAIAAQDTLKRDLDDIDDQTTFSRKLILPLRNRLNNLSEAIL